MFCPLGRLGWFGWLNLGFFALNRLKFGAVFGSDLSTIRQICQARFSQFLRTFQGFFWIWFFGFSVGRVINNTAILADLILKLFKVGLSDFFGVYFCFFCPDFGAISFFTAFGGWGLFLFVFLCPSRQGKGAFFGRSPDWFLLIFGKLNTDFRSVFLPCFSLKFGGWFFCF